MRQFSFFLFVVLATTHVSAQDRTTSGQSSTASATVSPPASRDDLRRYLVGSTWSWEPEGKSRSEVTFFADGTVHHNAFQARFNVRSASEVELVLGDHRVAKWKFDATSTHYSGTDFGGDVHLHGELVSRPPTAAVDTSLPTPGGGMLTAAERQYVGVWNTRDYGGWRSVMTFTEDRRCHFGDEPPCGTWSLDAKHLVVRWNEHPDWVDTFDLPAHDRLLVGHAADGTRRMLEPRSVTAAVSTYAALAGTWTFYNQDDGKRVTQTLFANGRFSDNGKLVGFWQVVGDQVVICFEDNHDASDVYNLPIVDGILYGYNRLHNALSLTSSAQQAPPGRSVPAPAATPHAGDAGYFGTRGQ